MIDIENLLQRLAAIEREESALILSMTVDAVPRWIYTQERTPYWINRAATIGAADVTVGDEGAYDVVTAEMGLIYGEPTAGIDGEVEVAVNALLPTMLLQLRQRQWLQSAEFPQAMNWLDRASVSLASNLTEFPPTPAGARRIGVLFRAQCFFLMPVEQTYLS